ncbi:7292_t:CDS:2, partial [Paraglomus brasilianum]
QGWKEKVVKELIRVTKLDKDLEYSQPGVIVMIPHMTNAGTNPLSSKDVLEEFGKFKDVVAIEKKDKLNMDVGQAGKSGSYEEAIKTVRSHALSEDGYAQLLIDFAEPGMLPYCCK